MIFNFINLRIHNTNHLFQVALNHQKKKKTVESPKKNKTSESAGKTAAAKTPENSSPVKERQNKNTKPHEQVEPSPLDEGS